MTTVLSELQLANAAPPRRVTPSGISTFVMPESWKADLRMSVTDAGRVMAVSLEQL